MCYSSLDLFESSSEGDDMDSADELSDDVFSTQTYDPIEGEAQIRNTTSSTSTIIFTRDKESDEPSSSQVLEVYNV